MAGYKLSKDAVRRTEAAVRAYESGRLENPPVRSPAAPPTTAHSRIVVLLEDLETGLSATAQILVRGEAGVDSQVVDLLGTPTGGTFTLSLGDAETAAIPFNATVAQMTAAVESLVGDGGAVVTLGASSGISRWLVRFTGASRVELDVMEIDAQLVTGSNVSGRVFGKPDYIDTGEQLTVYSAIPMGEGVVVPEGAICKVSFVHGWGYVPDNAECRDYVNAY